MVEENRIILEVVTKTKAGRRDVRLLKGSFAELDQQLKVLSTTTGGLGKSFKEARAELSRFSKAGIKDVKELRIEFQNLGKAGGGFGSGLAIRGGITGVRKDPVAVAMRRQRQATSRLRDRERRAARAESTRRLRQAEREERRRQAGIERIRAQRAARRKARSQAILQTIGFTGVALGTTIKTAFQGLNFQGIFGPVFGQLGNIFGSLFGQTIGAIFSDVFRAGGELAEALLGGFAGIARIGFRALGTFIETFFIAFITVGLTGPLGLAIGILGGFVRSAIEIFSSLITEIVNVFRSLLKAIVSIISALVKIVQSIFRAFATIIVNIWKGIWQTLKIIVQLASKAIIGIVNTLISQIAKGFGEFVRIQSEAAKTFGLVINVAGQSTRKFATLALKVASKFGFAMSDIQKTLFDVVSAGFRKSADASKVLTAASNLAIAGNASLAGSTRAVVSVLRAYGKEASEADRVTRVLFAGQVFARATVDEFASALTNIIPIASAAGVSFEDITKTLATITLSGFSASRASRGLSLLLTGLIAPSGNIRKKFEGIGVSFTEMSKEGKLVLKPMGDIVRQLQKVSIAEIRTVASRIQSRNAVLALKSGFEKFLKIEREFEATTKTLTTAQKEITAQFERQFKILKANVEVARTILVGGLAVAFQTTFKRIVDGLREINKALFESEAIEKFFKAFQEFAKPVLDQILFPIEKVIEDIVEFLKTADFASVFKTQFAVKFREIVIEIIEQVKLLPILFQKAMSFVETVATRVKTEFNFIRDIFNSTFGDPEALIRNFKLLFDFIGKALFLVGQTLVTVLIKGFGIAADFFSATLGPRLVRLFGGIATEFALTIVKALSVFIPGAEDIKRGLAIKGLAIKREQTIEEAPGETLLEKLLNINRRSLSFIKGRAESIGLSLKNDEELIKLARQNPKALKFIFGRLGFGDATVQALKSIVGQQEAAQRAIQGARDFPSFLGREFGTFNQKFKENLDDFLIESRKIFKGPIGERELALGFGAIERRQRREQIEVNERRIKQEETKRREDIRRKEFIRRVFAEERPAGIPTLVERPKPGFPGVTETIEFLKTIRERPAIVPFEKPTEKGRQDLVKKLLEEARETNKILREAAQRRANPLIEFLQTGPDPSLSVGPTASGQT